jgi:hypothetical protein
MYVAIPTLNFIIMDYIYHIRSKAINEGNDNASRIPNLGNGTKKNEHQD